MNTTGIPGKAALHKYLNFLNFITLMSNKY